MLRSVLAITCCFLLLGDAVGGETALPDHVFVLRAAGSDCGSATCWNFDEGTTSDISDVRRDGPIIGEARCESLELPQSLEENTQPNIVVRTGNDESGNPLIDSLARTEG